MRQVTVSPSSYFLLLVASLTTMWWYVTVAFTQEDLDSFKDPVYYKQFRHDLEADLNVRILLSLR